MSELYPLQFHPILKERIWGGGKIKSHYGYESAPEDQCGEAWLISGVDGDASIVNNGYLAGNELNELVEVFMGDLVGDHVYENHGDEFPILLKLIDSKDWLSIQVHPNDELSMERHGTHGKSEMWYVLEADPDARLISGFKEAITQEEYLRHFLAGTLEKTLNFEQVRKGDAFHLPAGRVHALGPGVTLAEVQQTSDITYRIHDWNRVDANGKPRELHTDLALDAIDFTVPESYRTNFASELNRTNPLIETEPFTVSLIRGDQVILKDYEELDSFVIYLGIEGAMKVGVEDWQGTILPGQALLVPNILNRVVLEPDGEASCLEIYIK